MFLTAFLTACVRVLPVCDFGTIWEASMGPFFCGSGALLFFLFALQGNIQRKRCIKSTAEADFSALQSNSLPIQKEENPGSNLG